MESQKNAEYHFISLLFKCKRSQVKDYKSLLENKYTDDIQWQIDVIAITINEEQNKAKINYIENAINHKDF